MSHAKQRGCAAMVNRQERLIRILKRHDVVLAYLFGSMAAATRRFLSGAPLDTSDPLADIDVGVVFDDYKMLADPAKRAKRYSSLFNDVADVFPEHLLDLVFLQETHSVFQARAMTGFCVYAVSLAFKAEYEERILARAADFRPFLERYYEERFGGVSQ